MRIPHPVQYVSDGAHSFEELYELLSLMIVQTLKANPNMSWRSHRHDNGTSRDGMFIVGMRLHTGDITFHLKEKYWDLLDTIETRDKAYPYDGHTSGEKIDRLSRWVVECVL